MGPRLNVCGELIRYAVTNSTPAGLQPLAATFWQRLLARGHLVSYLQPVFASVQHVDRCRYLQATSVAGPGSRGAPVLEFPTGRFEMQCMILNEKVYTVYTRFNDAPPELGALSSD